MKSRILLAAVVVVAVAWGVLAVGCKSEPPAPTGKVPPMSFGKAAGACIRVSRLTVSVPIAVVSPVALSNRAHSAR